MKRIQCMLGFLCLVFAMAAEAETDDSNFYSPGKVVMTASASPNSSSPSTFNFPIAIPTSYQGSNEMLLELQTVQCELRNTNTVARSVQVLNGSTSSPIFAQSISAGTPSVASVSNASISFGEGYREWFRIAAASFKLQLPPGVSATCIATYYYIAKR